MTDEIRNISRLVNDRVPTRERAELATLGHGSRRRQNAQRQCSAIPITGVWEARAEPRPYVSSKLICRVALDRAANWLTFIWIVWGRRWVFVNLGREPRFSPLRAETVAWQVRRLRRVLEGRVPATFTPHWFRHTHATALLLSGIAEHVVSRRLGHLDIQTTQNLYGWVSEDAEQRTVAEWQKLTATWRTDESRR